MRRILRSLVRAYTMNFPIENGKGRLIHLLRGYLAKPGDCVVARVGSGYLMQLDISEYIQRSIYFLGYYEASFARWLHSYLRPGMVFCDVGANVGQYSMLAAKALGSEGKVFAFEPEPCNFESLSQNVQLNGFGNIFISPFAVSDSAGERSFYVYKASVTKDANWGTHSLVPEDDWIAPEEVKVQVVSLNDVLREQNRVDVIKIDVEGAELQVLKGAETVLKEHDCLVLVEADVRNSSRFGYSTTDLKRFLSSLGYDIYRFPLGHGIRKLETVSLDEAENSSMLVATKHGRAV